AVDLPGEPEQGTDLGEEARTLLSCGSTFCHAHQLTEGSCHRCPCTSAVSDGFSTVAGIGATADRRTRWDGDMDDVDEPTALVPGAHRVIRRLEDSAALAGDLVSDGDRQRVSVDADD